MSSWVRPFHFSFTIWEDCGQQIGITVRPEGILDKLIFGQASHCALKCKWDQAMTTLGEFLAMGYCPLQITACLDQQGQQVVCLNCVYFAVLK